MNCNWTPTVKSSRMVLALPVLYAAGSNSLRMGAPAHTWLQRTSAQSLSCLLLEVLTFINLVAVSLVPEPGLVVLTDARTRLVSNAV